MDKVMVQTGNAAGTSEDLPRVAFERVKAELMAVKEAELLPINVDVPLAVTIGLGTAERLPGLRAQIATLPALDLKQIDMMETYAYATAFAHGDYVLASTPPESLPELQAEGAKLRELLLSNASTLAKHGLVDGSRLAELNGPVGYRNLAVDLMALAAHLREQWSRIEGKTPLTLEELEHASALGGRLFKGVGIRERTPEAAAEAALVRQRAFTLYARAYHQVRRAVSYLRWDEGDVDVIAPSLYVGRNNGGRRKSDQEQPANAPAAPRASAAAPAVTAALPAAVASNTQDEVPVGHFGNANPFRNA